ncbi:hypothetical protein [Celerinatantimonas sp. YJH-8]|uniref:hypothetical protein n=1 Tax=Celerinatantimonas sp. YJH-8 TaxID=3228714 RepID=UPI0038CB7472
MFNAALACGLPPFILSCYLAIVATSADAVVKGDPAIQAMAPQYPNHDSQPAGTLRASVPAVLAS